MAFDRTNPADLAALKTEVNTDPITMGYDPTGSTAQLLKLLNDPAENLGGETAARVFDISALLDALDPADLDAQQTNAHAAQWINTIVQNGDTEPYKNKFRDLFAANSATVTALDAQVSALSRGEVLFGQATNITREDWFAARAS